MIKSREGTHLALLASLNKTLYSFERPRTFALWCASEKGEAEERDEEETIGAEETLEVAEKSLA